MNSPSSHYPPRSAPQYHPDLDHIYQLPPPVTQSTPSTAQFFQHNIHLLGFSHENALFQIFKEFFDNSIDSIHQHVANCHVLGGNTPFIEKHEIDVNISVLSQFDVNKVMYCDYYNTSFEQNYFNNNHEQNDENLNNSNIFVENRSDLLSQHDIHPYSSKFPHNNLDIHQISTFPLSLSPSQNLAPDPAPFTFSANLPNFPIFAILDDKEFVSYMKSITSATLPNIIQIFEEQQSDIYLPNDEKISSSYTDFLPKKNLQCPSETIIIPLKNDNNPNVPQKFIECYKRLTKSTSLFNFISLEITDTGTGFSDIINLPTTLFATTKTSFSSLTPQIGLPNQPTITIGQFGVGIKGILLYLAQFADIFPPQLVISTSCQENPGVLKEVVLSVRKNGEIIICNYTEIDLNEDIMESHNDEGIFSDNDQIIAVDKNNHKCHKCNNNKNSSDLFFSKSPTSLPNGMGQPQQTTNTTKSHQFASYTHIKLLMIVPHIALVSFSPKLVNYHKTTLLAQFPFSVNISLKLADIKFLSNHRKHDQISHNHHKSQKSQNQLNNDGYYSQPSFQPLQVLLEPMMNPMALPPSTSQDQQPQHNCHFPSSLLSFLPLDTILYGHNNAEINQFPDNCGKSLKQLSDDICSLLSSLKYQIISHSRENIPVYPSQLHEIDVDKIFNHKVLCEYDIIIHHFQYSPLQINDTGGDYRERPKFNWINLSQVCTDPLIFPPLSDGITPTPPPSYIHGFNSNFHKNTTNNNNYQDSHNITALQYNIHKHSVNNHNSAIESYELSNIDDIHHFFDQSHSQSYQSSSQLPCTYTNTAHQPPNNFVRSVITFLNHTYLPYLTQYISVYHHAFLFEVDYVEHIQSLIAGNFEGSSPQNNKNKNDPKMIQHDLNFHISNHVHGSQLSPHDNYHSHQALPDYNHFKKTQQSPHLDQNFHNNDQLSVGPSIIPLLSSYSAYISPEFFHKIPLSMNNSESNRLRVAHQAKTEQDDRNYDDSVDLINPAFLTMMNIIHNKSLIPYHDHFQDGMTLDDDFSTKTTLTQLCPYVALSSLTYFFAAVYRHTIADETSSNSLIHHDSQFLYTSTQNTPNLQLSSQIYDNHTNSYEMNQNPPATPHNKSQFNSQNENLLLQTIYNHLKSTIFSPNPWAVRMSYGLLLYIYHFTPIFSEIAQNWTENRQNWFNSLDNNTKYDPSQLQFDQQLPLASSVLNASKSPQKIIQGQQKLSFIKLYYNNILVSDISAQPDDFIIKPSFFIKNDKRIGPQKFLNSRINDENISIYHLPDQHSNGSSEMIKKKRKHSQKNLNPVNTTSSQSLELIALPHLTTTPDTSTPFTFIHFCGFVNSSIPLPKSTLLLPSTTDSTNNNSIIANIIKSSLFQSHLGLFDPVIIDTYDDLENPKDIPKYTKSMNLKKNNNNNNNPLYYTKNDEKQSNSRKMAENASNSDSKSTANNTPFITVRFRRTMDLEALEAGFSDFQTTHALSNDKHSNNDNNEVEQYCQKCPIYIDNIYFVLNITTTSMSSFFHTVPLNPDQSSQNSELLSPFANTTTPGYTSFLKKDIKISLPAIYTTGIIALLHHHLIIINQHYPTLYINYIQQVEGMNALKRGSKKAKNTLIVKNKNSITNANNNPYNTRIMTSTIIPSLTNAFSSIINTVSKFYQNETIHQNNRDDGDVKTPWQQSSLLLRCVENIQNNSTQLTRKTKSKNVANDVQHLLNQLISFNDGSNMLYGTDFRKLIPENTINKASDETTISNSKSSPRCVTYKYPTENHHHTPQHVVNHCKACKKSSQLWLYKNPLTTSVMTENDDKNNLMLSFSCDCCPHTAHLGQNYPKHPNMDKKTKLVTDHNTTPEDSTTTTMCKCIHHFEHLIALYHRKMLLKIISFYIHLFKLPINYILPTHALYFREDEINGFSYDCVYDYYHENDQFYPQNMSNCEYHEGYDQYYDNIDEPCYNSNNYLHDSYKYDSSQHYRNRSECHNSSQDHSRDNPADDPQELIDGQEY